MESAVSLAVLLGGEKVGAGSETLVKSLTSAWHVASAQQCLYFLLHKALSVRSFRKESPLNHGVLLPFLCLFLGQILFSVVLAFLYITSLLPAFLSLSLYPFPIEKKGQTDGFLY